MLSIIIPCFNEEKYLQATLDAVFSQDYSDYEIIVVDDCSTDTTVAVAQKNNVTLVRLKKRSGVAVARNAGAKKATGDYLIFLDADVHLSPGCLRIIAQKRVALGTCRSVPSNTAFIHRLIMWLKNNFYCWLGVSNGIILCRQDLFDGFPLVQQGEDGLFVRRLKKKVGFSLLSCLVVVSTRRYEQEGYFAVARRWLTMTAAKRKKKYSVVR